MQLCVATGQDGERCFPTLTWRNQQSSSSCARQAAFCLLCKSELVAWRPFEVQMRPACPPGRLRGQQRALHLHSQIPDPQHQTLQPSPKFPIPTSEPWLACRRSTMPPVGRRLRGLRLLQLAAVTSPANSPACSPRLHRQFPPLKCQGIIECAADLVRELGSVLCAAPGRQLVQGTAVPGRCEPGARGFGDVCQAVCWHEAVGTRVLSPPSRGSVLLKAGEHPAVLEMCPQVTSCR